MGGVMRAPAEALSLVQDGDSLAISKFTPVAALLGLVAAGRRGLHVIGVPTAGFGADLLAAGGAMARLETGALVIGNYGTTPNVVRGIEAGTITLIDSACPMIELQLIAGASGLGFTEVPGMAGSDVLRRRRDLKVMADPFDDRYELVVAPAMRPDVAIIHGLRADAQGNVVASILNEDRLMARAAKRVIATVEEMRDDALARLAPDEEVIPELFFDAVSVVPGGARPFGCPGLYEEDRAAVKAWLVAARDVGAMAEHLAGMVRNAGVYA